ncbi:MAG: TonB-dependent receptor [Acidobacteria bacterium]|nr:TonB-dependent receptor [Acidobacteriota bacterium]MCB9396756.1 TonB-dependent receptor [Acidobacteriota bacterium]
MIIWLIGLWCVLEGPVGQIQGRVVGLPADPKELTAQLKDTAFSAPISQSGEFSIKDIHPGTYQLQIRQNNVVRLSRVVTVVANQTLSLDLDLRAAANYLETVQVHAVSRTDQSLVHAPAAVTVLQGEDLYLGESAGQLPNLLGHLPGVDISQTGTFDFNVNARGLNTLLNRRVVVLVDGRNTAVTQLGNQEWFALGLAPDDINRIEFVRGPSSALYGANAFNGVLDIRTKSATELAGGTAQFGVGENNLATARLSWGQALSDRFALAVRLSTFQSDQWEQSRTAQDPVEYAGLRPEALALNRTTTNRAGQSILLDTDVKSWAASLRLDYQATQDLQFSLEAGTSETENFVGVADIGRGHIGKVERPFYRVSADYRALHASYWRTERNTPEDEYFLASGGQLWEQSYDQQFELTYQHDFSDVWQAVIGGSAHWQDLDTSKPGDPTRRQSSISQPVDSHQEALFGQIRYQPNAAWQLVLADRFDQSTLHDSEHSPKVAINWTPQANQSVRLTYNRAFQSPSFPDFFLYAPAGVLDLTPLEAALEAATGVPLPTDFGLTPVVALGNESLRVEQIETWELGYRGMVWGSWVLDCNVYRSEAEDFVTELLPGVNPNVPSYQLPAGIPEPLAQAILGALAQALGPYYPALALDENGRPQIVLSYTNAGAATLTGFEFQLTGFLSPQWQVEWMGTYLDFDRSDALIEANAPEWTLGAGSTYQAEHWQANLKGTYRDGFYSAAGIYAGPVPSYFGLDGSFRYQMGQHWDLRLSGTNLLDRDHYAQFGGAVIGRMTQLSANYSW